MSKTADEISQQSEALAELRIEQSETAFNVSHILETVSSLPSGLEDIKEIRDGVRRLLTREADGEANLHREKVLSSLSTLNFRRRHHDILRQHQPGTGQWFLDMPDFRSWLEDTQPSCLWCTGLPGSGKTVITSMAINYIADLAEGQSVGMAYIYCQYKDAENETTLNMVSALTQQLTQQVSILPLEVNDFYNNRMMSEKPPTVKDYVDLLLQLSDHFAQVYIFVDALDECSEDTREELLSVLERLQSFARLFLTSRPHISIDHVLRSVSRVNISATDSDIKTYLKAKFSRRGSRLASFIARDPSLETDIVRMVSEKAGGMFLLARLQMDRIGTQTTPKSIRKTLSTLPSGIQTTYADAIERIKSQGEENATLAMRVLSWLYSARRDLEVDELLHALAVEDCDTSLDPSAITELDILLSVCAGLVTVEGESHVLRLVHFTLQEYLDSNSKDIIPDAQEQLSRTCLKYLSFDVFNEGPCPDDVSLAERLQQHRFADYAARYWGLYLKGKLETDLSEQILQYLEDEKRTSSTIQISWQPRLTYKGCYDAFPKKVPKLHIAASWGMEHVLTQLLHQGADIAGRDSNGKTALHWAVLQGDAPIVRTLIKRGIEVNAQDGWGETALQAAAKYGNLDVVELLLDEGARADIPDQEGDVSLHIAARNGHADVLRLLLTKDTHVNRKNHLDLTPIHLAAIDGHERVVRLLLEKGADIEATGEAKHTLLHILAFIGEESIARILVEKGANVDAKTVNGVPVLSEAAKYAKPGFIKLLLDHGANINARYTGNHDETVLQAAVMEDNSATLSALLDAGADINMVDDWTRTALFEASKLRKGATLKLLLERGADPNMKAEGVLGRAPLHEAARRWEPEYVLALLKHGAEPNPQDSSGRTPLHEAASRGHRANVELLLQHGADPNSKDLQGRTVLETADVETLDLLLERGAKPGDGQLTLIEAAMFGQEATVKTLLEQGADINARGSNGKTALHEAAMCYYRRTNNVRRLLEHGADPGVIDLYTGQTPLHLAAWVGDIETVRVLLEYGADPNAETTRPSRAKTALIEAARNASDPLLIKLLLEHGADPNARDHWRHAQETALHPMAVHQKVEMLKILLDFGADINIKDSDGRTAIQKASKFTVIKRLLEEASASLRTR